MTISHLTATEATMRFASGELSPVELLTETLKRVERTEPVINAVTEELRESAFAAARESERRFAEGTARPLEGIPLMLKDEQPIQGRLHQDGSLLLEGEIAEVTHPIVDRILAAGAVVHARTTTPEFCCAPVTHTQLWGVTRNPFNTDFTPGGSSGGSGAALAAGSTMLATGSDIGGSIRIPASFCGVIGFKPPFGRVPGLAPYNSDTYCADGPMGRSVADVARLQNVISGPWAQDQASLRETITLSGAPTPLAGVRIALSPTLGAYSPDPAVVANTLAMGDALRAAGATVDEVELPWSLDELLELAWAHFGAIMGSSIEDHVRGDPAREALLMPYTRGFIGRSASSIDYAEGLEGEARFYRPLGDLLERYDALICPSVANTGFAADDACADPDAAFTNLMTLPFNVVGRVPVLSVPSGRAPNGVPTGVQIVGKTYDDRSVFSIGAAIEAELELWTGADWWPAL
ncbi:amidase [Leucobacter sp. CSA1]|uniref:Amidase n=1 Tax=Leucobacter chromiisoli TaxID=2796471 RepID=A0A934Q969_9MICO|nr:amidase [Leucobacter chromiisoli]MBK0420068.1 amidase [Leucobacter chromiisoli]